MTEKKIEIVPKDKIDEITSGTMTKLVGLQWNWQMKKRD